MTLQSRERQSSTQTQRKSDGQRKRKNRRGSNNSIANRRSTYSDRACSTRYCDRTQTTTHPECVRSVGREAHYDGNGKRKRQYNARRECHQQSRTRRPAHRFAFRLVPDPDALEVVASRRGHSKSSFICFLLCSSHQTQPYRFPPVGPCSFRTRPRRSLLMIFSARAMRNESKPSLFMRHICSSRYVVSAPDTSNGVLTHTESSRQCLRGPT
jgi:hypothetical protein